MDGILIINKPMGITSFDVVQKVRKLTGIKKVGHAGTLDPEATGVLPVCIGRATKIIDFIMNGVKIYKAELKLGIVTDTYDREGKIIREAEVDIDESRIIEVINSFVGNIEQVPPMYSAIKVKGKKLYELARSGIEIEREPRLVTIYNIKVIKLNLPYVEFEVTCSKGTYIRSLCFDIGEKLRCGGAMWNLERKAAGDFYIEDSITLDELTFENVEQYIIPIESALSKFERLDIDDDFGKLLMNGVEVKNRAFISKIDSNKFYRVYLKGKGFIGIGYKKDTGFKMTKLLV